MSGPRGAKKFRKRNLRSSRSPTAGPILLMIAMGIGLVLYSTWYYTKIEALNILAFIVLIVGALFVWYRQT